MNEMKRKKKVKEKKENPEQSRLKEKKSMLDKSCRRVVLPT